MNDTDDTDGTDGTDGTDEADDMEDTDHGPPSPSLLGDRREFTVEASRPPLRWQPLVLTVVLAVSTVLVAAWVARARLRDIWSAKVHPPATEEASESRTPRRGRIFADHWAPNSEPTMGTGQPPQAPLKDAVAHVASHLTHDAIDYASAGVPPLPPDLPPGPSQGPAGETRSGPFRDPAAAAAVLPGPQVSLSAEATGAGAAPRRSAMMIEPSAGGTAPAGLPAAVVRDGPEGTVAAGAGLPFDGSPRYPATSERRNLLQSLGSSLSGTRLAEARAARLGARDLVLARGAYIPCVLETQLVSNIAGFASCIVTDNIFSDNGHTVLIERGSHVTGEYQSAVRNGDARLFVLWNRIKTPGGVLVNLDSPGGDAVGGQGLPGAVDNHWWDRIGAAFLLSSFQDAVAIELARANRQSAASVTTINTAPTNTVGAAQDLSKEILANSLNVPPTIYKNRGELLTIYVARDLRFDDVYVLR